MATDPICGMTADNQTTARTVADQLGIDEFEAGVRPEDKHARIKAIRAEGGAWRRARART